MVHPGRYEDKLGGFDDDMRESWGWDEEEMRKRWGGVEEVLRKRGALD